MLMRACMQEFGPLLLNGKSYDDNYRTVRIEFGTPPILPLGVSEGSQQVAFSSKNLQHLHN